MLKGVAKISKHNYSMINNPYFQKAPLERVMTTNSWPVPYYKRIFKAYPVREDNKFKIDEIGHIDDRNHLNAKNNMNMYKKFQQHLNQVEKTMQKDSYVFQYEDITKQAQAYVYELSQFVHVAQKENKRILSTKNLL
jgi:hypothetical protein